MNRHFRTTTLNLDDDEHIDTVDVFADETALPGVMKTLGDTVEVLGDAPGGKRLRLTLSQALTLYSAAGKLYPASPLYAAFGNGQIYRSLAGVRHWEEGFDE